MQIWANKGLKVTAAKNGMSLSSLAKQAGITRVQISRIANGENTTPDTAGKIAKALGVPVVDLFSIIE